MFTVKEKCLESVICFVTREEKGVLEKIVEFIVELLVSLITF